MEQEHWVHFCFRLLLLVSYPSLFSHEAVDSDPGMMHVEAGVLQLLGHLLNYLAAQIWWEICLWVFRYLFLIFQRLTPWEKKAIFLQYNDILLKCVPDSVVCYLLNICFRCVFFLHSQDTDIQHINPKNPILCARNYQWVLLNEKQLWVPVSELTIEFLGISHSILFRFRHWADHFHLFLDYSISGEDLIFNLLWWPTSQRCIGCPWECKCLCVAAAAVKATFLPD